MYLRNRFTAVLFIALLLLAPVSGKSRAQKKTPAKPATTQKKPPAQTVAGTAVFMVSRLEDGASLDPIVLFNKGQYINPLPDENEAFIKQVAAKYIRTGQKHRVIFGGAEAGTVIVKERFESEIGLTSTATLQSSIKLSDEVRALAVSSETLGGKQSSRRAPTAEERAAMVSLMNETYKQKKVSQALLAKVKINNITAIDIDGDGKAELIGSFEIFDQKQNSQNLFLIAEWKNNQYQSGLTWFKRGGETDSEVRRLIDVLDLDGDGLAEVFATTSYYESTDFTIYKKLRGVWRSVYQGGFFGL
jgi:hypothetical protein